MYLLGVALALQVAFQPPHRPMFYAVEKSTGARTDARGAAVLKRRIALALDHVPVGDALDSIAARSGIRLNYSPTLLPPGMTVTLTASDITVAAALTDALLETDLDVLLRGDSSATIVPHERHQGARVSGRVIDAETHLGVPAVAVVVTGTTIGTQTTDSGTFTLQVPANAKSLTARRIAYLPQTVPLVEGTSDYTIELHRDVLKLEEQVVTGVATSVSSQHAANDVSILNAQDITAVPAPTLENALQGQVPSALIATQNSGAPGGGLSIQIRGITSINATASPLYVVDGVIVNNETVFSGTTAITNAAGLQPSQEDNGTNRIADINPNDIESIEVLKGASASAIYGSKASSGVIIITTKRGTAGKPLWQVSLGAGHFSDAQFLDLRTFPTLASAQAWATPLGYSPSMIKSVYAGPQDFQSQLFSNSQPSYLTSLSVSGTAGGTQYFLSALSKYDNGVQTNTGYQMNSVRANISQQVSSAISISANIDYAHSVTRRGISGNDNVGISPYDAFAYTPQFVSLNKQGPDGTWPTNPFGPANPFADAAEIQTPETIDRFIGGGTLSWTAFTTPHQSLKAILVGGADYTGQRDNLYAPPSLQVERALSLPGVALTQSANTEYSNVSLSLVHHYTGLSQLDLTTSVGVDDEHRSLVNPSTVSQDLIAGTASPAVGTVQSNFFTQTGQHDQSWYAQEQVITLGQRLAVTGGITAERSSNDGNVDKFYAYPRASASFLVPRFLGFLDELKLRVAYGESGTLPNYGVRYTPLTTLLASGLPGVTNSTTLGAANIRPESEAEIETGFDATMFHSRAQFSATVYQKKLTNLLLQASLPQSVGYQSEWLNGGAFTNQGIELSLSATPVQIKQGPTWVTTTTFFRNYGVVNSLPVPAFTPGGACCAGGYGGPYGEWWIQVGRSVSEIVNNSVTTPNGSPLQVGDGQPAYIMTFNNSLAFRALSLSFLFEWQRGASVSNLTSYYYDYGPRLLADTALETKRIALANAGQNAFVEPASALWLRQAALNFTVPHQWITWALGGRIASARLSLTGRNLLHWYASQFTGLDPQASWYQSVDVSRNLQITPYPPARSYFVSLDLGF